MSVCVQRRRAGHVEMALCIWSGFFRYQYTATAYIAKEILTENFAGQNSHLSNPSKVMTSHDRP